MSSGSPLRAVMESGAASRTPSASDAPLASRDADGEGEADGQGIRHWQRSILARLTRARQRRDIRFNRKEVLSLQLVMEAVMKQYMALAREVESVKATLKWEALEPVSLSRALSRLQAERREEAAALANMLACKDKEVHSLEAHVVNLRESVNALQRQTAVLEQSCREKDSDLERAATALATLHAMHKMTVQDRDRQHDEALAEVRGGLQRHALRHAQAEAQAQVAALQEALADKQLEAEKLASEWGKLEARLRAELSKARTDAAACESHYEMESMRLSRALTERESHANKMVAKVETLHADLRAARADAAVQREVQAAADAKLAAAEAEVARLRDDRDTVEVLVSKALNSRDFDAQHLRDAMEVMRKEHAQLQQALRDEVELLRSQRDVDALAFSKTINERDLRISELMIEAQAARAHAEDTNAGLLKTIEAMNAAQTDREALVEELQATRKAFADLQDSSAASAAEVLHLHQALQGSTAELDHLRRVVHDLQREGAEAGRLREAVEDARKRAATEADRLRRETAETDRLRKVVADLQADGAEAERLRRKVDELQKRAVEVDDLQRAVDELQQKAADDTGALRRAMQELHDSHALEVEQMQKALAEAHRKRRADADHFRGALHEKDVQIRDLHDKFLDFQQAQEEARCVLEARNEELAAVNKDREQQISVLKNSVEQMKGSHRERSAAAKQELDKTAAELAKHKQAAEQARADLQEAQGRCRRAEAELGKLEKCAEQREARLSEMAANLQLETEHFAKQRDKYQEVIREKDGEVLALREKVGLLEGRVDGDRASQAREAAEAAEEAERLRAELNDAVEQKEALVAKFSKLFKVVRRSFDRRSSERAALEQSLEEARAAAAAARSELEAAVHSHAAEQDKVMKMMLGKDNDMKQLRENLHQYEEHLRSTKEELDSTIAVLRQSSHRKDVELRKREANAQRLQALLEEAEQNRAAGQDAVNRAADLERSLQVLGRPSGSRLAKSVHKKTRVHSERIILVAQESQRRVAELEMEVNLNRSVFKKTAEDSRQKAEKLQQNLELARREYDSELAVANDAVVRLQEKVLKAEARSAHLADEAERLRADNGDLRTAEAELRTTIECLEAEVARRTATDERIAALEQEHRRMGEALQEALQRDAYQQQRLSEALQDAVEDAVRAKDEELTVLQEEHRRLADSLQEAVVRKDERIAALEEAVSNFKAGMDLDVLHLKDKLSESEDERRQLASQASTLEAQLQDQISLMAKRIADKDHEIVELLEARAGLRARFEKENADLAEDKVQLLGLLQGMQRERDEQRAAREAMQAEMQEAVRTTHGALRAKEDQLQRLREEAAEAGELRRRLAAAEDELSRIKEQGFADGQPRRAEAAAEAEHQAARVEEADLAVQAKDAELKVLGLANDTLKQELVVLRQKGDDGDAGSLQLQKQLRSREAEVEKLKQTVQALKTDLGIQKQILLTFHEGRAYLGAPSVHDGLSRTAKVIRDLRNTTEVTALFQDGDHRPVRHHRGPQFELKRAASVGDHLDAYEACDEEQLLCEVFTPSPSSLTLGTGTDSEVSTASAPPQPLPPGPAPTPASVSS
ncbi:hypothetical protein ONE63_003682 [Megalurothrips usitatus]|uniref:Uncharacterized protein n=1 Tax=Megalurothrips usitatus TaxID=439358 RepID=A0AAV7X3R6_9NEOP|nr:hypothetical protein ONE63_003682 [Megalurothrips usitatus]